MARIGNNYLSRTYNTKTIEKIVKQSEIQDIQYNRRLSMGDTFFIGENQKQRFFLTRYEDGAVEIWTKIQHRSGFTEEVIVCLNEYEVACINTVCENISNGGRLNYNRDAVLADLKNGLSVGKVSKKHGIKMGQAAGVKKMWREGKLD